MNKSIFEFTDYKAYLREFERSGMHPKHGFRSRLAKALGCHTAYVSQVLKHDSHLSLEQGEALNLFAGHDRDESLYFLLLVQKARAGSTALKKRLDEQITDTQQKRLVFKNRVDIADTVSKDYQLKYYSAWYFAAVHITLTIPEFQTKAKIQERLGLSAPRVSEVLDFLVKAGLARKEGDHYVPGVARIFLERESEMYSRHHANWRVRAVESLDHGVSEGNLHFSSVVSLARADLQAIQEAIIQGVENARKLIKDSKEEEVYCFGVDFFKL